MSYRIKDSMGGKVIVVREHNRGSRVVRPYVKGLTWRQRLGRWIWSWLRTPVIYTLCGVIFASVTASAWFGGELYEVYHPTAAAEAQVILLKQKTDVPPLLKKIAFAETRDNQTCDADAIAHHFCKAGDAGNVLVTINTDGSTDTGAYAINNYTWGAQAAKLGYDIYTEDGNQAFAIWLFDNYGTAPWGDSKARWGAAT